MHKKKSNYILLLLSVVFLLSSCQRTMNSEEIYSKSSSGVVFILNFFYYSMTLPDGSVFYFTGFDDEGNIEGFTSEEDEVKENCAGCTGTGFFISDNGTIMTNRHVAQPSIDEEIIKSFLKRFKQVIKDYWKEEMKKLEYAFYENAGNNTLQGEIAEQYKLASDYLDHIDDMDMNDAEFNTHCNVGIAYNDTHVVKYEDFVPCSVLAVSEDSDVDLALIQLDDETTPEGKYIFRLRESDEPLSLDEKLFMIGFNLGFDVAKTTQGIRAQIYSGNVSQKDDGTKILYSIPSQHGSSGSPVVNERGELVAVNFAGIDITQGFNYGIPTKKIREFLQEN